MWTFWSDLLREWENRKITIQEESCDRVKGKESLSEGIFQCHVSPWAQKWDWQATESSTFSAYVTARQSLLGASYHQSSLRKEGRSGNAPISLETIHKTSGIPHSLLRAIGRATETAKPTEEHIPLSLRGYMSESSKYSNSPLRHLAQP